MYSAIGNLTNKSDQGAYTYGETNYANPNAVTDINGTTYTYDKNGNVTTIGSNAYGWDYRNRLLSSLVNATTSLYAYNHNNLRVLKGDGTATTTYPNRYHMVNGATTTNSIFLPDGTLVATVESVGGTATTTNYIHPDHLGSTNVITDSTGALVSAIDHYPFGTKRVDTAPNTIDRQFIGERFDDETSLSYLNARYYDGDIGKFLSQDPLARNSPGQFIADPQKFNSYSYARNNPIAFLDISGLSEAYFNARSALGFGPWRHTYQAYSIDSQAEANQLSIGVSVPSNVSADNPFNFTLGFGPINGSLKGGVGYAGGLGDNAWSRDYSNASLSGFTSSGYNLSPGSYGNYAQLANESYNVSQAINAGGVSYGFLGGVFNAIAIRNYYNSNSAISTVSNLTGQGNAYNQFLSSTNAPGGSNNTISATSVGSGSVAQSTPSSLIGNQLGAFVGTYSFGSAGTYNFGSQSWVE